MKVCDSRKALAFGVLLLAVTLAAHAVAPKGAAAVKDIALTPAGDSLEARITTTGPAKFTYFELAAPRRLVVDFRDQLNSVGFTEKQVSVAGLERIRTSVFHDKDRDAARIVFDITKDAEYRVVDDKSNSVRVMFGRTTAISPVGTPKLADPPSPVTLERLDPPALIAELQVPANLAARPAAISPALQQPLVLPAIPRPTPQFLTLTAQDLQLSQVVAVPQTAALLSPTSAPTAFSVPPQITVAQPSGPGSSLSAPAATQYTGEIVTFDVRDLELKDFFRLISETSGLNVALDQNVSGTIPMLHLNEVPWDQALALVLKQNSLSGVLQGNILRIATNATLQTEESALKAQADAKDASSALETHTYILSYTKADIVEPTVKQSLSKRGDIIHDVRKNALIVSDIPSQFSKVDQMVKFLDTPAQQVEIEGRLLSADKSFSRDLGAQIGLLVGNKTGNILTGVADGKSALTVAGSAPRVTAGTAIPTISNFPAAASSGLSFLLQPGGNILLDTIVTAAENSGRAKLLAAPRITTQNNQPASVTKGTQIPVQTNVNNTVAVQFISFALNLTVTPQITAAGTILLTVQLENSVPDFSKSVNGIPPVATQKATTTVLIPDGGTAVIGGIYVDSDALTTHQVPGLGSIPLIGHLFKDTSTIKSTSELIFFVTPKIKSLDQIVATAPDVKAEPQK